MPQVRSDMAGTVVELKVKVGDKVTAGQEVAIVESMKMEVPLVSASAGTVSKVLKAAGDFLNDGEVVIELS